MKKSLILITVLLTIFLVSCGQEVSRYNTALDGDRGAREKMLTALSAMRDANMFAEEAAHGWEALVEEKKAAAVADFDEAINSWKVAKEVYLELIKDFPENPEYLNNLGNLIYNMAYNGLEADLEEAKDYLNKALAIAEKTRYTRNLELIEELKTSEKTAQTLADNIKLIEQIRAAK